MIWYDKVAPDWKVWRFQKFNSKYIESIKIAADISAARYKLSTQEVAQYGMALYIAWYLVYGTVLDSIGTKSMVWYHHPTSSPPICTYLRSSCASTSCSTKLFTKFKAALCSGHTDIGLLTVSRKLSNFACFNTNSMCPNV